MDIQRLQDDLERDEGFVSHAYKDSEGYLTIGIGRLIDKQLGGGITKREARHLLENDIRKVTGALDRALPWWRSLPEGRMRALANMCFNLGLPRLLGFKKMLAALEANDWQKAADEALDSKWARQVGDRSKRISDLIRGAVDA